MTLKELAAGLGVSLGTAWNLKAAGIPLDDLAKAKEWYALRHNRKRRGKAAPTIEVSTADDNQIESLEDSLPRVRRLEKGLALAAERAFREGKTDEAISLRREHVAAIKALYDAESKLIKINESRGRLISVDRALGLINDAMQSAILVLRRLPELGRDAEERRRLEAFLNGVLAEIKTGAADGSKHGA